MTQVECSSTMVTSRHIDEPAISDTTIAASNNFHVAKEEHKRYVDDLLPDFIYTWHEYRKLNSRFNSKMLTVRGFL